LSLEADQLSADELNVSAIVFEMQSHLVSLAHWLASNKGKPTYHGNRHDSDLWWVVEAEICSSRYRAS